MGELVTQEQAGDLMLAGTSDLNQALAQENLKRQFIANVLKEGEDYGVIPGTKKKGLFKPGSEKLLFYHGLGVRLEPGPNTILDHKAPFFVYEYKAVAYHKRSGIAVAECIGTASSTEPRYAYVWVQEKDVPRGVGKDDLPQKKARVWLWSDEKKTKVEQWATLYRIDNPDLRGLLNTISKIAQKRAITGVALIACRASTDFEAADDDDGAERGEPGGEDSSGGKSSNAISEGKLKRLYAIQKEKKVAPDALMAYLRKNNPETVDGDEVHPSRIDWKKYDAVIAWLEAGGK